MSRPRRLGWVVLCACGSDPSAEDGAEAEAESEAEAEAEAEGEPGATWTGATLDPFDQPVPGLAVALFAPDADPAVDAPLATTTSGKDGGFALPWPEGTGFVRASGEGYLAASAHLDRPLSRPGEATACPVGPPGPLRMVTPALADSVAQSLGFRRNGTLGLLLVTALDCDGEPVAGATLASEPSGSRLTYVTESGIADDDLTATTDAGSAVDANVPVGAVAVTARDADGAIIGTGSGRTFPGELSQVAARPE